MTFPRRRHADMLPNALALVLLGGCGNAGDVTTMNPSPSPGQDPQSVRRYIGRVVVHFV